jgi:DNA-binding helix-hairpin-helix protein with protein kinase domain
LKIQPFREGGPLSVRLERAKSPKTPENLDLGMILFDSKGNQVRLGPKLAEGGEGVVHRLVGRPDTVAKVYHHRPSQERVRKLSAMVAAKSDALLPLACWPTELLIHESSQEVTGFLMPHAVGYKEVFKLYNPRSRYVNFEDASWKFLIHAATNIARAFAAVHLAGHVIGDVNHSSAMVGPDATAMLIDCDSFQVKFQEESFLCEVGEPLHTPPELQGRNLRNVVRTPNHDNFGLAVLIFEILFMGRHPFAGAFNGGEMSLEDKIRTFRFAYGPRSAQRQMNPPPGTLPLEAVSPNVAELFELAFSELGATEGMRPQAIEWVHSLDALEASLTSCSRDFCHDHWSGLTDCPWCQLEATNGVGSFGSVLQPLDVADEFDLAQVWYGICRVKSPPHYDPPDRNDTPRATRTSAYQAIFFQRMAVRILGAVIGGVCLLGLLLDQTVPSEYAFGGVFIAIMMANASFWIGRERIREAEHAAVHAHLRYESLVRRWTATASSKIFQREFEQLKKKKQELEGIMVTRQREFEKLEAKARDRQLRGFLEQFSIQPGIVPDLTEGRCATLAFHGMLTAADVEYQRVRDIYGFGVPLAMAIVGWRKNKEVNFVFDQKDGVNVREFSKLEAEISDLESELQRDLLQGRQRLLDTSSQIRAARIYLRPRLELAVRRLATASADSHML